MLLAGVLFGLTVWAFLQYFGFPLVQPLVTEKGFPPQWYAASFGVYGLVLGLLVAAGSARDGGGDGGAAPRDEPGPASSTTSAPPSDVRQNERERMEEWRRRGPAADGAAQNDCRASSPRYP